MDDAADAVELQGKERPRRTRRQRQRKALLALTALSKRLVPRINNNAARALQAISQIRKTIRPLPRPPCKIDPLQKQILQLRSSRRHHQSRLQHHRKTPKVHRLLPVSQPGMLLSRLHQNLKRPLRNRGFRVCAAGECPPAVLQQPVRSNPVLFQSRWPRHSMDPELQ